MSIYDGINGEEVEILNELIGNHYISRVQVNNTYISNGLRPWIAIFSKHLRDNDKTLYLSSNRYYFRQEHLDEYYPTNPDRHSIAPPFDQSQGSAYYHLYYIDTSTGSKIYDYATALCKAQMGYVDRQSLAVTLTENKNHRVKIVHLNNTVWILSNQITDEFIEKSLALFPFLFDINELKQDEHIMNCCKAVAKNEPIKEYFKDVFSNLAEIRKQKQIDTIKNALNSRTQASIQKAERDIRQTQEQITGYLERLDQYYRQLEDIQMRKLGYESKRKMSDEEVKTILEYIDRNRFIQNMKVVKARYEDYDQLQLNIIAPITIYESEPLQRQIANRVTPDMTDMKAKIFRALNKIFVEEKYQMICQTYVNVDLVESSVNAARDAVNKQAEDYSYVWQPHLTRFNCWGDNINAIKDALRDADLLGAINNILIATQNINFTDSTVLNNWLDAIQQNRHLLTVPTAKDMETGDLKSILDIINIIEEEQKAKERQAIAEAMASQKAEETEETEEEVGHPELTDEVPF